MYVMENNENNQMKKRNSQEKQQMNGSKNGNRDAYIKGVDICLKKCSSDITTLKSNNSSLKNPELDDLDKKWQELSKKLQELKSADENYFEEIKDEVKTESEELLKDCEEAVSGGCA